MQVTLEDATPRMLNALYAIEKQCFNQEAFSKNHIALLLSDYNTLSLAAKIDGELAGFVMGQIEEDQGQFVGHILTIDVLPEYRRKGIAQRLLAEIEGLFRQKDIRECRLEVREDNAAALELYRKLGYVERARLEGYYRSAHGLYMTKMLT